MSINPILPRKDRLRTIERPFAWIPFRLLKSGLFKELSDQAKLLYIFLCLAADRQGTSYYGDARIQTYFQFDTSAINQARRELIEKDMVAYDGRLYQVLSLPSSECHTSSPVPPPKLLLSPEPANQNAWETS